MKKTAYERLVHRYETEGATPLRERMNEPLLEFFQYWLDEKEAEFLLALPEMPTPVHKIAQNAGITEAETRHLLATLVDKTMVVDHQVKGSEERLYSLASYLAWCENYLHRYVDLNDPNPREIDVKFGRWLESIKHSDQHKEESARMGRIIPMERAITDTRGVIPLSEASKIVDEAEYISVMRCPCRSSAHLTGTACDHPLEVCFSMDDYARYQVEYGYAREVTKEWAKKTLRECEERGLIHVTDNIEGQRGMLCNCCSCHCTGLTGLTKANQVDLMARTAFFSAIDPAKCEGSGRCVKKCPFHALEMVDGKARLNEDRCIGCGVCTTVCPNGALSLEARPPEKTDKYYHSIEEYLGDLPPERISGDLDDIEYIH